MIRELIVKTRSIRRFKEDERLDETVLRELIDLARLGGSARNSQPLRYMMVTDRQLGARIFPHLGWAGYLTDWPGPAEGERPPAYVICLLDRRCCKGPEGEARVDLGIATQNLLLGAAERNIHGCRIGSFSPAVSELLQIDGSRYKLLLVIALGRAAEEVVLEEAGPDGDIRYWRDRRQVHHVPKRALADIIIAPGSLSTD